MLLNSYIILMKKYGIVWLKTRRQKCILFFYPYIFHEIVSDDLSLFL